MEPQTLLNTGISHSVSKGDSPSQYRHPRSALHMHLEVSEKMRTHGGFKRFRWGSKHFAAQHGKTQRMSFTVGLHMF